MTEEFPKGLSATEATVRQKAEGVNELHTDQKRTLLNIVLEVVREPMFLLLLGAGAIYLAMGDRHEAAILLGFVFIIMAVTIFQERRTENALDALRDLSSPRALVIRDGVPTRIAGRDVVREDIVILTEGDRVPADGNIIQAHELAADESMLTGESVAVAKFANDSKVFAGTMLVRGQGVMQVTAIGGKTELGKIGKSLQSIAIESSPLRDEINLLTKRLAIIGIFLCISLALVYFLLRGGWLQGLLAGITLAMGILPQELPVIMIVFFALGARRIATQRVLTRRLNAIETLGETTVLCVDKTGTLTQNRMTVAALSVAGELLETDKLIDQTLPEPFHELLEYAVLASEIDPHDPMEQAFHRFAFDYLANTEHLHPSWNLAREYELSPELLAMSHLWQAEAGETDVVATKGAPEAVAELCHLPEQKRLDIANQAERMADRGLRVLGVAKARFPSANANANGWPDIQHDFEFEFIGLVGLADPLRAEVPAAVTECKQAGIRVVMITGDHPRTASAIARNAGICDTEILTGTDLLTLNKTELATRVKSVNVFARVTPQQKLDLVEALKANGEVVAMTGDGVNDAPALKSSHIGIAMGKRGTDVAREAASLVLLEDDFTAIVAAIHLGRRIFSNLRQALVYTLAVHIPIIGLSVLPVLFGLPLMLAPMHIAFLELVIDPACSVVFEAEAGNANIMQQPPRSPSEQLISNRHIILSLTQGLLCTLGVMGIYYWFLSRGVSVEEARSLAFVTLVTANTALIFPSRSAQFGLRAMFSGFSNVGGWVLSTTMLGMIAITTVPVLAEMFTFKTASLTQWLLAFFDGLAMMIIFEGVKLLRIR